MRLFSTPGPNSSHAPRRSSRQWAVLLILSAVAFMFFWQYFLLDQTLYAGDTAFVFFPFRHFATARLMAGEIPLWNPYLFGGTPGLAESTYQVFYPPNLLFWLTGVPRGIGWTLPLHLLWLSVGVTLFARRSLGLGRLESVVAALAFTYCGSVQGRLGIPVYTQAASWIPWILLGYDFARRRGGLALLLPGLALVMQLLTGGLPYTYYTLVLLLAFHLFRLGERAQSGERNGSADGDSSLQTSRSRMAWLALGATLLVGFSLFAAQLLPELELARLSERGTRASYDYATYGSLLPRHLVTMLLPKFYGLYSTPTRDGFLPSTELGYVGVLTLGLAGAAWFSARRREVIFWILVAFLGLFLALGRNNPVYPLLYRFVPGVGTFRTPGCWLLISGWALAMLAARGVEVLRSDDGRRFAAARLCAALLGLMALGSAALLIFGGEAPGATQSPFGGWTQVALTLLCAVPPALLAMPRLQLQFQPLRRGVLMAMPVLIALDLFLVAQDMEMQQTLSVSAVDTPSPLQKVLQTGAGGGAGMGVSERFWPDAEPVPMEKWIRGRKDLDISVLEYRAKATAMVRALMPSCLPAEFETMGLTGAWGSLMPLRRNARPLYAPGTPQDVQRRWLRLLNARTYLSQNPLDDPQLQLQSSDPLYIYRDEAALPRAFWVPTARRVHGEAALETISQPAFDPRQEVLLEAAADATSPLISSRNAVSSAAFDPNAVKITEYRAERIQMEVQAPRDGYVVLMDSAFPGWKVAIDGQNAPLEIANWMGRAVAVHAGNHRITMWFEPSSVRFGAFLSLLSLGAIGMGLSAFFFRRSHSR